MKNRIKQIRIIILVILLLILVGKISDVIVKYVDAMKTRNILNQALYIVSFLLFITLIKNKKIASPQVTIPDFFLIGTFVIVLIAAMISFQNRDLQLTGITNFPGNNGYDGYVLNDAKGYGDLGIALENSIINRKRESNFSKLEEIYRMQAGENIYIYLREDEKNIVEYKFLKQDDLYYSFGSIGAYVLYDERYTAEETVREDMLHTMARGEYDKLIAPAWGISADERIFSMTINGKKADDVVPIYEKDGNQYYFWIITNVEEIKTMNDVKAAKIELWL